MHKHRKNESRVFLELCKDLKKVQVEGAADDELISFIEDIRKHLREDIEYLEMHQ